MTYSKLTKNQLIELVEQYEAHSVEKQLETVKKELVSAGKDLMTVCRWLYEAGRTTRRFVSTFSVIKRG